MKPRFLSLLILLLGSTGFAERTHDITVDDYFTQAYIAESRVSPDGKLAAYVELRWRDKSDGRAAELWTVEIPSGERRRS